MRLREVFLGILLVVVSSAYVFAADPEGSRKMDKEYIKANFPEVYNQIFQEGRDAALKGTPQAQETAVKKDETCVNCPEAEAKAAASKTPRYLADWWNHNSLKYSPMPEKWQSHLELQYRFIRVTGNDKGTVHAGGGGLTLRKGRFTNYLNYAIDKKDITQSSGGSIIKENQVFEDSLQYDLTDKLSAVGGLFWEKESLNFIDGRFTLYGGLGYTLFDKPVHSFKTVLAYGWQDEKYASAVSDVIGLESDNFPSVYFKQNYDLHITEKLSFNEEFRIIHGLTRSKTYTIGYAPSTAYAIETGDTLRYRWYFTNGLRYQVTDCIALGVSYLVNYDSNPWPVALRRDTRFQTNVMYAY